jgi:hypothetical protein
VTAADLIEFLKGQFSGPAAEQLGRAAGFSGSAATRATQAALPVVLNGLANRGQTEAGAADLLTRSRDLERLTDAGGNLNTATLADPAEIARLEGQGRGLLGSLFPNVDEVTGRLGSAVGGSGASAGRLLALLSPLVLAVLAGRARSGNVAPGGLSSLLGGVGPLLPALLPAGLAGLAPLLAPPVTVETVAAAVPPPPRLVETPPPPPPAVPVTTTTVTTARRGGFPWWLIPLLLLLLLGGCWLLQNRPAVAPAAVEDTTPVAARLVITEPEDGAEVPASGFNLSGTGPAGETFQLFREDAEVGTINVGDDGTWNVDVVGAATDIGEQTYSVRTPDGSEVATLPVTAVAVTEDVDGSVNSDLPEVTLSEPAEGADVPASGFNISGTGTPGETLELIEDDVAGPDDSTVGTFTVGEDGNWTVDVPGPNPGDKVYVVRTPAGAELAALPLTVVAAQTAADCTDDLTLSLDDGERVTAPFRVGGLGNAENYTVTVKRGERVVGTQRVALTADCTWSYLSRPGGREGVESQVTYEVRPSDADATAAPLAQVNLTVVGSGVNFNEAGEYVSPTGN